MISITAHTNGLSRFNKLIILNVSEGTYFLLFDSTKSESIKKRTNDLIIPVPRVLLSKKSFPVLDNVEEQMTEKITEARKKLDSVGGIVQTAISGIPAGVGEPWFDSFEGVLSHALFSIGGVKGIEFGQGFNFANMLGSQANDQFEINEGKIITKTNNNGGINGGITNGMPIIFNLAVKPTPSIAKEQQTVNIQSMENATIQIEGRHDPAIIRRICVVVDSVCALVACDMLAQRYGTDVFTKGIK